MAKINKKPRSLQQQLVKSSVLSSVAAGLIALLLLLIISVYQTMHLQDQIMDEMSDMLMLSDISKNSGAQVDELSDQFDIHYRLMYAGQTLTQSEDADSAVFQQLIQQHKASGYSIIWYQQRLWRVYVANEADMTLYAAQLLQVRFKDIVSTLAGYAGVLVLLWLLQWLIVHFMIRRQFKPLHALSTQIAEKHAEDLSPIQTTEPEFKELAPIKTQLNYFLQRLEQSLIAEQRFTADAAHELRSPLSAIQMRLQVLERKYQDTAFRQDFVHIEQDVQRGTQVLENLLLLARLDPAQAQQLPKIPLDLAALCLEVIRALEPFAQEKQIGFHLQLPALQIYANRELMFTCIRNLIDNAIRYANVDGQVSLVATQNNHQIEFTIMDDGQQLTPESLQHLGERFYRALGSQTQGSGLGLSICKKIIELHQGEIHFSQTPQGGLKVHLWLNR